jgi:hypothetical protein
MLAAQLNAAAGKFWKSSSWRSCTENLTSARRVLSTGKFWKRWKNLGEMGNFGNWKELEMNKCTLCA